MDEYEARALVDQAWREKAAPHVLEMVTLYCFKNDRDAANQLYHRTTPGFNGARDILYTHLKACLTLFMLEGEPVNPQEAMQQITAPRKPTPPLTELVSEPVNKPRQLVPV